MSEEAQAVETQDVNPEPAQPSEPATQEGQPPQPSAETQNTEEAPGPVPYERFKEQNEKLNELKSLTESQDWQGYQQLKNQLDQDPAFAQYFLNSIQTYQNPQAAQQQQQPQEDPLQGYPEEIAEPLRRTQDLEQQVQSLTYQNEVAQTQAVRSQYVNSFNSKCADSNIPEYARSHYAEAVELEAGRLAASQGLNALGAFNQQLLDKAFENVDKTYQSLERNIRGSYQVEKKNDRAPVSTSASGQAGQQTASIKSSEDRAKLATELLKASQG